MNNVAEPAFSEMFRVLSEFQFLGSSCRGARPPSILPQVAPVSTSMSPHAAAQTRAQGSPGPACQGHEPCGAHPLSTFPRGLLVWSDTPDPHHLLALGLRAP